MGEIKLDHLVVSEEAIFACGRDHERKVRLFLIRENEGKVYSRNGRSDSWEEIFGVNRADVVNRIVHARHNQSVPVYKISSFNA